jgi:hypothetical protein
MFSKKIASIMVFFNASGISICTRWKSLGDNQK